MPSRARLCSPLLSNIYNAGVSIVETVALSAGLAWASGIRLYLVLFLAGLLARLGYLDLPEPLSVLSHPLVLGASGVMLVIEFVADKVPAIDSTWDALHTFIRIPAGAFLAAAALGTTDPAWVATAAILGGSIVAGTHLMKAGGRALINTSPEPISNWLASTTEDLLVPVGLFTAIMAPVAFLIGLAAFAVLGAWLLPKLWRGIRDMLARFGRPAQSG
jgi:Domain of unknown function (DUF4126)